MVERYSWAASMAFFCDTLRPDVSGESDEDAEAADVGAV